MQQVDERSLLIEQRGIERALVAFDKATGWIAHVVALYQPSYAVYPFGLLFLARCRDY